MIYRALRGILSPAEVDELELWQIGVLLDGDTGPRPPAPIVMPPRDPGAPRPRGPVLVSVDGT
jgi:hypothetical protein